MSAEDTWPDEVGRYLTALARGDRAGALGQVRALRSDGHSVQQLARHVLAPAQRRVGELWVADAWSVAQEHAATAISEAVLTTLTVQREQDAVAPGPDAPSVVVCCVEQEWHALAALMVAEHLRTEGFAVSYLGANSSAQGLVRHVHELSPRAVLLSCSLPGFLPAVRRQVEAVRETGTPVLVGGSAFDPAGHRAEVLGATAYALDEVAAVDRLRTLPAAVPPAPPLTHVGAEEAFVVFGEREPLADEVERRLRPLLGDPNRPEEPGRQWQRVLEDQLTYLVASVAGALVSDDPRIVQEALSWAALVLRHRDAPATLGPALREALHGALRDLPAAARLLEERPARPPG